MGRGKLLPEREKFAATVKKRWTSKAKRGARGCWEKSGFGCHAFILHLIKMVKRGENAIFRSAKTRGGGSTP